MEGGHGTWLYNCSAHWRDQHHSTDYRCRAIFYARTISAVLSMAGCTLVLFIIMVYKKYQQFTQRLIAFLLLPSFIVSAISVYPDISNEAVSCEVAGFFMNFGLLGQRLLIMCIVVHLLLFTFLENRPRSLEAVFHIVTWSLSFGLSFIPLSGRHYGSAGVWCWIKGETS